MEYVWYVCYGSNLLEERFLCYIKGGKIPNNDKFERGAKDKSLPVKSEGIIIPYRLFFSFNPPKWNGSGVAFINYEKEPNAVTYGRKYLITKEQFLDVIRQENSLPEDYPINIDKEELIKNGSLVLFENSYYGRLLYLGISNNYPMYSFTCITKMSDMKKTTLFGTYYDVIANGLKETYVMNDNDIKKYLNLYT
jgi:hypothetical protein